MTSFSAPRFANCLRFLIQSQMHVISTEGGAFAAAVERPLYFVVTVLHPLLERIIEHPVSELLQFLDRF
ncbi:MAG: hypothetical protein BGO25_04640 [Acidobacteriales bacterium 59-55]|nr:MAG: hypothetical protein BGO25_04640 [Acidobacteriales bacterium 59-55]